MSMSSQSAPRRPSVPSRTPSASKSKRRTFSLSVPSSAQPPSSRRAGAPLAGLGKVQRTSKTSQKLVLLPTAPQTRPLPDDRGSGDGEGSDEIGYETDAGVRVRDYKNRGERMSKPQRRKAGFRRITAYCVAEALKMKLLSSFVKREHNVVPRIYDEAMYAMYHLPLLPGYGPASNIRASAPADAPGRRTLFRRMSDAEDAGYQGTYFTAETEPLLDPQGYIPSSSPLQTRASIERLREGVETEHEQETDAEAGTDAHAGIASSPETIRSPMPATPAEEAPAGLGLGLGLDPQTALNGLHDHTSPSTPKSHDYATPTPAQTIPPSPSAPAEDEGAVAEVIFFDYGVVVFFGLSEHEERSVLDDIERAGILRGKIPDDDWEVEECHYVHDPNIAYPRIYNDFFTLRSHSHLLKLSIAHALAQSTLLAHFESSAARVLSAPETVAIPRQLARSGRLFKLRRDINLVSPVLDVPELFWSEASLGDLYGAVREYMEIAGRVQALNEKLGVASDLLDAIHDHLNNSAMERITWIIIWLIVAAIVVELGEVVARLIVHATTRRSGAAELAATCARMANASVRALGGGVGTSVGAQVRMSREDALRVLERMVQGQS